MPVAGLICRSCGVTTEVSGRHWAGECDDPTVHPGIVQAGIDDLSHAELALTPTTVLGKVRDEFIKRTMPIWPTGQSLNATTVGQIVGRAIEAAMKPPWRKQIKLRGEFWGEPFTGTADLALLDDGLEMFSLWDDKFGSERAFLRQVGSGYLAKPEHRAQISMYLEMEPEDRELAPLWVKLRDKAELRVWYGSMLPPQDYKTKKPQDSWLFARAPRMSVEEIAALRPIGGQTTTEENTHLLAPAFRRVKGGEDPRVVARDVPMECKTSFGGMGCQWYCASVLTCYAEAGIDVRTIGLVDLRGTP